MKYILLILVLFGLFGYSQKPLNFNYKIKSISTFENEKLIAVEEYDTLNNLIFSKNKQYVGEYWNGEYITMIHGDLFNKSGKIEKSYQLHSNAGLSIWYNEYDKQGNIIKVYERNNDYDENINQINTNPYNFISGINCFKELIANAKVIEIESKSEKFLLWEQKYDTAGNMILQIQFNATGDTSSILKKSYNENNDEIYFYNEWYNQTSWEYFYSYEQPLSFKNESTKKKHRNLLQSVRVEMDWGTKKKSISDVTHYKYDNFEREIESIEYRNGVFTSQSQTFYNKQNKIEKELGYNADNGCKIEINYKYKDNRIDEETKIDYCLNQKEIFKYKYIIDYYK